MDFKIRREDYSTYDLGFSTKPLEDLIDVIASHRLSKLFFPDGVPAATEIYIRRLHKKDFWLLGNGVWAMLNPKNGDAKIEFHPDIYKYEIDVKWEDFNSTEVLDKFAEAIDCAEQVVVDFACRFYDLCKLKENREWFSCDFDIDFYITNLDAIRCDIGNDAAYAGTSFVCSLDELRTKDAQSVFDTIACAYEGEEL
jgi:hypothetical protein